MVKIQLDKALLDMQYLKHAGVLMMVPGSLNNEAFMNCPRVKCIEFP